MRDRQDFPLRWEKRRGPMDSQMSSVSSSYQWSYHRMNPIHCAPKTRLFTHRKCGCMHGNRCACLACNRESIIASLLESRGGNNCASWYCCKARGYLGKWSYIWLSMMKSFDSHNPPRALCIERMPRMLLTFLQLRGTKMFSQRK